MFAMDSELESEATDAADVSELEEDKLVLPPQFVIDLEISSVYKPRPMRKRFHHIHPGHHHHANGSKRSNPEKGKKGKDKHHYNRAQKENPTTTEGAPNHENKAVMKRQARDRRREEKKRNLLALATQGVAEAANGDLDVSHDNKSAAPKIHCDVHTDTDVLVGELEALHVGTLPSLKVSESISTSPASTLTNHTDTTVMVSATSTVPETAPYHSTVVGLGPTTNDALGDDVGEDDDDMLITPAIPAVTPRFVDGGNDKPDVRLIVEVLVVRKMSLEEAYLDFEGFSFV